jgi:D-alanyl-D-alanine carboxypeptidase (penicillin-binding protein 5/6)
VYTPPFDPERIVMASTRTARLTGERTARVATWWRRAAATAAGALIAAALIGPTAANAGWSSYSPHGGGAPAGYGAASQGSYDGVLPPVTAAAAIVVDRDTGEVLGANNPDQRWAPASTTKMMTALVAVEAINAGEVSLSDTVTIPDDVGIEIDAGCCAGLRGGDTISFRDLLYMTLVKSEGDAATTVAMHVGGYPSLPGPDARDAFIERMNERAAELGLRNTHFVNVSGADPEDLGPGANDVDGYQQCTGGNQFDVDACAHYSTARDLAALARVVLDDPVLATIVSSPAWATTTWRRRNPSSSAISPMSWRENNTNQLLPGRLEEYPGAYGVKTGTSDMAGENLVSAARYPGKPSPSGTAFGDEASLSAEQLPSGLQSTPVQQYQSSQTSSHTPSDVIAVVLGSDSGHRFSDSKKLLDFGLHRTP